MGNFERLLIVSVIAVGAAISVAGVMRSDAGQAVTGVIMLALLAGVMLGSPGSRRRIDPRHAVPVIAICGSIVTIVLVATSLRAQDVPMKVVSLVGAIVAAMIAVFSIRKLRRSRQDG